MKSYDEPKTSTAVAIMAACLIAGTWLGLYLGAGLFRTEPAAPYKIEFVQTAETLAPLPAPVQPVAAPIEKPARTVGTTPATYEPALLPTPPAPAAPGTPAWSAATTAPVPTPVPASTLPGLDAMAPAASIRQPRLLRRHRRPLVAMIDTIAWLVCAAGFVALVALGAALVATGGYDSPLPAIGYLLAGPATCALAELGWRLPPLPHGSDSHAS